MRRKRRPPSWLHAHLRACRLYICSHEQRFLQEREALEWFLLSERRDSEGAKKTLSKQDVGKEYRKARASGSSRCRTLHYCRVALSMFLERRGLILPYPSGTDKNVHKYGQALHLARERPEKYKFLGNVQKVRGNTHQVSEGFFRNDRRFLELPCTTQPYRRAACRSSPTIRALSSSFSPCF